MSSCIPTHASTFRISPGRRLVLWWVLGPLLVFGLALMLFGEDSDRTAGLVIALLMAVVLGLWQWLVAYTRLILSPDGILLRQVGMQLATPWENVEAFFIEPRIEGFIVREPLTGKGAKRLAAYRSMTMSGQEPAHRHRLQLVAAQRFIPIEPFASALRGGNLLRELERFRPDLAAMARTQLQERLRRPSPPRSSTEKRRVWTVGIIITIVTVAGLATAFLPDSSQAHTLKILHAIIMPCIVVGIAAQARTFWLHGGKVVSMLCALFAVIFSLWTVDVWIRVFH